MAADQVLLEREHELARIDRALDAAAAGEGGALAIEGKAGVGKTRLLTAARARAGETGFAVLSARATELERDFPFAVVRQLLGPQLSLLSAGERDALFEGAGAARGALGIDVDDDRSPDPFSVLHALYWVLAGLAERAPLLIAIDDSHLADPGSLDWLAFMLPRVAELPALLLSASRTGEAENPGLTRVLADPSLGHLAPAALSTAATEALIEKTLRHGLESPFAAACHQLTGGNPFLVTELAHELRDRGIEPRAGNVGALRGLAPERVTQMVLARISRLSPEASKLARSVAILGEGSDPALAAGLAELDAQDARRAADALRRAAILDSGEVLRFVHPLVRNAVYAELAAGERGAAHAQAAALLRARGAPPQQVATQLLAGEARGNRAAVETLLETGERSLADGAPRSAVAYLTRALREPPPADLRLEVLGASLRAGIRAADHDALATAEPELRAAVENDPASGRRWVIRLTTGMVLRGRFEAAAEVLQTAIQSAVEEGDVESAFRLEAQLRAIGTVIPSTPEVDLQRYVGTVDADSPAGRLAAAIEARGAAIDGTAREAAEAARRALGNDGSIFEEEPEIASAPTAVLILHAADDMDAARQAADRALEIAHRRDATPDLARGLFLRGLVSWGYGDLVAAEGELRQAIDLSRLANIVPMLLLCSGPLGVILIDRDELDAADAVLEEVGAAAGPIPQNALFSLILFLRGVLRFERSEFPDAVEDFSALAQHGKNLGFGPGPGFMGTPYRARALVAMGRPEDARRLMNEAIPYARKWGSPATVSHALRGLAVARGGAEEVSLMEEAVSVMDGSPRHLLRTHALVDLGATLRRRNRRADARAPLREGLKLARRCGAVRLARRAQQELQASGETVRRYAPIGVESLTPSERRVAELAASGMTNRQIAQSLFVTLKTVEAHLSAAYDKLDISSRRELGDALSTPEAD